MQISEHRERSISSFFPIAFLLILFLLAFAVPIIAPACMLHVWLWLRYARSRRHYLTFAGLMAVPVGLFIALPLIANATHAWNGHGAEGVVRTRYVPGMLMMLAGGGVIPIMFRFLSAWVLCLDANDDRVLKSPRGSILDGLALTFFCVVICLAGQMVDDPSRYNYSAAWSLIATIIVSLISIVAMRINARCSRAQMFANFAAIWIGGWLLLKGTLWGIDTIVRPWLNGPDATEESQWLFIRHRSDWDDLTSSVATFAIAIFPLICRRYVFVLVPICSTNKRQEIDRPRDESEAGGELEIALNSERDATWIGKMAGHLCLLAMIAMLTLYPFTWTEEYIASGYRIAGWPLAYWHAEQTSPSSAPWYWTDSSIWRSIDVDLPALVFDILLMLFAWIVILPPLLFRRRLSPRTIEIARWALGSAFAFAVAWNAFLSPMFRDWRLNRMDTVTVNEYLNDGHFPLFQRVAHEVDSQWRGTQDRMQRGGPVDITIRNASADEVDAIVRQIPTLKQLTLQNCDLPADRVSELAMDASLNTFTFETDDLRNHGIVGSVRSGRDNPYLTTYTLKLTTCGGEIFVPDGVDKLQLVIPHRRDSTFELKGMSHLKFLEVQNTFGDVPNSVSRIRIEPAPELSDVRLDTMQKFALDIPSAPRLATLIGFSRGDHADFARLTELKLSGQTEFGFFHLNLTDLVHIDLQVDTDQLHVKQMRLRVDETVDTIENSSLPDSHVQQIMAKLSAIRSVDNLELNGLDCNDAMLRRLPDVGNALTLNDCIFQDDIVAESYGRFASIILLNVENLIATSEQIAKMKNSAMNTIVVNSRGDNRIDAVITTSPPHIIDIADWVHNAYFKMGQYLTQLTNDAKATGNPGTFELQISDPQYIAPGMQTLIDDARASGVTVRINP